MKDTDLLDKTDTSAAVDDDLPGEIKAAQRRVRRAVCTLPPPGNFTVLIEQLAQEMAHAGIIPGTALFEPFVKMQVGALIDRVRGICHENGVELAEEVKAAPAPVKRGWFYWLR